MNEVVLTKSSMQEKYAAVVSKHTSEASLQKTENRNYKKVPS